MAHRLAMDWPDKVKSLTVLDIAPTREMYAGTDDAFARAYWHWFFLILPHPVPERMIEADPRSYVIDKCGLTGNSLDVFHPDALKDYITCFSDPEAIRASCDDYRAAATIDIEHDDADGSRKLECPLLVLWGKNGVIEKCFDALAEWRKRASNVRGQAVPAGHYIPEEISDELSEHLLTFFKSTEA